MTINKRVAPIERSPNATHLRNSDSYLIGVSHHLLPVVAYRKIFQSVHSSRTDSSHLVGHLIYVLLHDRNDSTHDLNCSNPQSLVALVSMRC